MDMSKPLLRISYDPHRKIAIYPIPKNGMSSLYHAIVNNNGFITDRNYDVVADDSYYHCTILREPVNRLVSALCYSFRVNSNHKESSIIDYLYKWIDAALKVGVDKHVDGLAEFAVELQHSQTFYLSDSINLDSIVRINKFFALETIYNASEWKEFTRIITKDHIKRYIVSNGAHDPETNRQVRSYIDSHSEINGLVRSIYSSDFKLYDEKIGH